MARGLLSHLADLLFYEIDASAPQRPREAPGFACIPSPDLSPIEQARALLTDRSEATVSRVIQELEVKRVLTWDPEGLRTTTVDEVLDALRTLARNTSPPRVPTLSRLAWAPVEPLLVDGCDPRPWSVPRKWLRPAWGVVARRAPDRVGELAFRYARLVEETNGNVPVQRASEIAAEVQIFAAEELAEALQDQAAVIAQAGELFASAGVLDSAPRLTDHFIGVLTRLRHALVARIRTQQEFFTLRLKVRRLNAKGGWRDGPEADALQYDVEQVLAALGGGAGLGGPEASPAAAFLVLLGRSVAYPWPLLEAVRRRTRLSLLDCARPLDTRAPGHLAAFVEDLVGTAEVLAGSAEEAIARLRRRPGCVAHASAAVDATVRVSAWLRGLEGVGFLDQHGDRYGRLVAIRAETAPLIDSTLLSTISDLAHAPVLAEAGEAAVAAAEEACRSLRALLEHSGGLRVRASVLRLAKAVHRTALQEVDAMVALMKVGQLVPPARIKALVRVCEAVAPGTGQLILQRFEAAHRKEGVGAAAVSVAA